MADLRISQLPNLIEADLRGPDLLPLADVSASETKHITTAALFKQGMQILPAQSIPGDRLVNNSVTALQLAPDSVTASELADGAVDTAAVQNAAITDVKIADGINGVKIADNSLTAIEIDPSALGRGVGRQGTVIGLTNNPGAGGVSGITWDQYGQITGGSRLIAQDLPIATSTSIGGVSASVPDGLFVSAAGALGIANTITPGTSAGITYDRHGLITGTAPIGPTDLPLATDTTAGILSVPSGEDLVINGLGQLSLDDTGVAPGDHTKVTVNARGLVTGSSSLADVDIPDLDASKIVSGFLDIQRIADHSVSNIKLDDYAVSFIQEAEPSPVNVPIGTFWFQESTSFLHQWNGNSWMGVGIGRLSQENMRFCGIINADTGLITGVTSFGVGAGYAIGDVLRAATDAQTGVYFVTELNANGQGIDTFTAPTGPTSGPYTNIASIGGSGSGATFDIDGAGLITLNAAGAGYKNGDAVVITGDLVGGATPANDISISVTAVTPAVAPGPNQGRNIQVNSVKGVAFDTGDWVICNGAAAGWDRVDLQTTLGGGGGGGGAQRLDDLLDVDTSVSVDLTRADRVMLRDPLTSDWHGSDSVYGGTY